MKVSVSLPDEDVEYLDAYAETQGLGSRSAALLKAAVDATAGRNEFDARRRAELLKSHPPAALPKAR